MSDVMGEGLVGCVRRHVNAPEMVTQPRPQSVVCYTQASRVFVTFDYPQLGCHSPVRTLPPVLCSPGVKVKLPNGFCSFDFAVTGYGCAGDVAARVIGRSVLAFIRLLLVVRLPRQPAECTSRRRAISAYPSPTLTGTVLTRTRASRTASYSGACHLSNVSTY
jgi:hypothetical protein